MPISSVPAEQANSNAKFAFNAKAKLHYYTFKVGMCIRSWMELFIILGIPMPNDFQEAYEILKMELPKYAAEDDEVIDYMLNDKHGR